MPRLIVLNGPPAVGKSTLAQRYVDEHPLALNLDIDRIRALLGQWRDDPYSAGLLARSIALAAARTHLTAGRDVVIPQFLGRPAFLEQVAHLAAETGAEFHEVVLLDSRENALRRYTERSRAVVEGERTPDPTGAELSAMYDRLLSVVASRPTATVIPTVDGQMERAYQDVLNALGDRSFRTGSGTARHPPGSRCP